MARLAGHPIVLPVQVLGEAVRVLHGRMKMPMAEVQAIVERWSGLYGSADSTATALASALTAVAEHQLQVWDALILAVAAEQRCTLLLTEDLQHGFSWNGVTIVNPFVEPVHPRLKKLLR
jgi:predicted nucleic acid-binding protein